MTAPTIADALSPVAPGRAAELIGLPLPSVRSRLAYPLDWRLSELRALYAELDDEGREALLAAMCAEVAGE